MRCSSQQQLESNFCKIFNSRHFGHWYKTHSLAVHHGPQISNSKYNSKSTELLQQHFKSVFLYSQSHLHTGGRDHLEGRHLRLMADHPQLCGSLMGYDVKLAGAWDQPRDRSTTSAPEVQLSKCYITVNQNQHKLINNTVTTH